MYSKLHRNLLGGAAAIAIAAATTTFAIQPAAAGGYAAGGYDWTGFTIGGHIGAAQSEWSGFWATDCCTDSDVATFSGFDDSALAGGVHIGYNYGMPGALYGLDVVVGAEADWTAMGGMNGNATSIAAMEVMPTSDSHYANNSVDWTASLRGRLGLALGPIHTYATLGAGWVNADAFVGSTSAESEQQFTFRDASWVWGLGFEYLAAHNLVLGAEFQRYEVDDRKDITLDVSTSDGRDMFLRFDDLSVIRAKMSYKFGAEPVVHRAMK